MCFSAVTTVGIMAFTSAWSTQFRQFFHSLPPPPPPSPSPFYQNAQQHLLLPRYRVDQPQFRQPLLQWYQPLPTTPTTLSLRFLPSQDILSTADLHQHHYHHHHHMIYYYYLESDRVRGTPVVGKTIKLVPQEPPCDGHQHPVDIPEFPPEYLPQLPQIPPTTMSPILMTDPPCDDNDTVVVDNIDYYPFGKKPIVVRSETAVQNHTQQQTQNPPQNVSNFILSNYLLPPDK